MTSWILVGCMLVVLATLLVMLRRTRHLTVSRSDGADPTPGARFAGRSDTAPLIDLASALPNAVAVVDRELQVFENHPSVDGVDACATIANLSPDDATALRAATAQAIDSRARQTVRLSLRGHSYVAQIIPSPPAERRAFVWLRDISDEKIAAERAERLAKRNEAILRSAMDGFFVVADDHHFVEVNDAFCRMIGYSAGEMKQLKISDLETREQAVAATPSHMRTGLHHIAKGYRHKDGRSIQLETSVIVLRDGDRHVLVGFAREATERLRYEQRLVQANERFAALVARMPLGYIAFKRDWTVQEWNSSAEKIFGRTPAFAVGRDLRELVTTGEQRPRLHQIAERVAAGESSGLALQQNLRADGTAIECEWFYTVIRDAGGEVESIAAMVRDVSERERLEQELRRSQKLESLGVLAGGVAHDFNNFLVTILCNASMLAERLPAGGEAASQVQKIVNASRRASDLTRQMLTYAGGARLDVQPTDLGALISEIIEFMRAAIPKNVALRVESAADLPLIDGDSGELQQVVLNLVINGSEAIGDQPGEVLITTGIRTLNARQLATEFPGFDAAPGEYVTMSVRDTGCGMTRETAARIFDPFFTTKFTGRGLGLAMILGIVRSHHGCISVQSEVGRGTLFSIILPAAPRRIAKRVTPAAPTRVRPGATVLVIDDDEDIRDVVRELLESRGVQVLSAADGQEGVALFRRNAARIDVVLLDLTMPGMSGAEVFSQLREIRPDARVIVSSGYSESEASSRFNGAQVAGFVQKPYTAGALVEKVGAVIG